MVSTMSCSIFLTVIGKIFVPYRLPCPAQLLSDGGICCAHQCGNVCRSHVVDVSEPQDELLLGRQLVDDADDASRSFVIGYLFSGR